MAELFSIMGFESYLLERIHYKTIEKRKNEGTLEFLWNPFNSNHTIFTHVLSRHYSWPSGFAYESP